MMKQKKKQTTPSSAIAQNKKAFHDYAIERRIEAGLALEGWEVKSLRRGRAQLQDSYVLIRGGEAWMVNAHISALDTVSTHFYADPRRARKLLLKAREINQLIGATQEKGFTLVPLKLYWQNQLVKVEIALVKGKRKYDKREAEKKKDWQRQKSRLLKHSLKR